MPSVRVQEAASWRLDEIYRYTRDRWGEQQAHRYVTGLFDAFERIESHGVVTILHERMHQIGRFKEDFFGAKPGAEQA